VTSDLTGKFVATASGDATVKLWDTQKSACSATLCEHDGDVYTVEFHPAQVCFLFCVLFNQQHNSTSL